jgi:hypothetical protein
MLATTDLVASSSVANNTRSVSLVPSFVLDIIFVVFVVVFFPPFVVAPAAAAPPEVFSLLRPSRGAADPPVLLRVVAGMIVRDYIIDDTLPRVSPRNAPNAPNG